MACCLAHQGVMVTTGLSAAAGAAIRRLRRDRGWTLADLSTRSGVPLSSLSKMELGHAALGYEVLLRVCRALEVEIGHLIRVDPRGPGLAQASRRAVIRAGQGAPLDLPGMTGLAGATELLRRNFTPVVLTVTESQAGAGLIRTPGEAYLLVLDGTVTMHSDPYAPLVLQPGDGVFFDAQMGFALTTEEAAPARALLIHQGQGLSENPPQSS